MKSEHNGYQDTRLDKLEKHFGVLNDHSGKMKEDIVVIKTDICWIKKKLSAEDKVKWSIAIGVALLLLEAFI